jgi:hypothetical protein
MTGAHSSRCTASSEKEIIDEFRTVAGVYREAMRHNPLWDVALEASGLR